MGTGTALQSPASGVAPGERGKGLGASNCDEPLLGRGIDNPGDLLR